MLQATIHSCTTGHTIKVPTYGGKPCEGKLGHDEVLVTVGTLLAAGKDTDVREALQLTSSAAHLPKTGKGKGKSKAKGKGKGEKNAAAPLLLEAHTYTLWPRNFIRQVLQAHVASPLLICCLAAVWPRRRLGIRFSLICFVESISNCAAI